MRSGTAQTLCMLLACLLLAQAATAAPPQRVTVYKVPSKIKSDCSVPVDDKISAWLATVPDNSTVQFGSGGCYGQAGTIALRGRAGLVIDGQGAEFRALTPGDEERANWRFVGGRNLTVQNLAVRGTNPQGLYDHAVEWQHGFAVEGVQGMTLANVQARDTWGDGVFLWHGAASPACGDDASSARNVMTSGGSAGAEWAAGRRHRRRRERHPPGLDRRAGRLVERGHRNR